MNSNLEIRLSCSSRATGTLILIGILEGFEKAKTIDIILGKCKCPNSCPYFQ